jgi:hypothetical protein
MCSSGGLGRTCDLRLFAQHESVADAQRQADAAAIKGSERVMDAKRDAANAEIKAGEAVAMAEDKAVNQVDRAQADALQKTGERRSQSVARTGAERLRCGGCQVSYALTGADFNNCKSQAQADLDAAKAQADVTRQDVKSEANELKN